MPQSPEDPICPICRTDAKLLDKVGDSIGYDCGEHGRFRVADSIFSIPGLMDVPRGEWEAALKRAKDRQPGEWAPIIMTTDFKDPDS